VSCIVGAAGVVLPVSVNGKAVNWLLDTGFNMSALSESEARMLGLPVHAGTAQTEDFAGGTAPARTAVAPRVTIGGTELRNVPMLVFPDSQPPWNEFPAGRRGTVGLPMALALQTVEWTTSGTCHVGVTSNRRDANSGRNLAFDRSTPLTRVRFEGRSLDFVLDTGNQGGTQLWARFAREFSALVSEQGRQGARRVSQIGG